MRKNYKKMLSMILVCVLTVLMAFPVYASNNENEWYDLELVEDDTFFEDLELVPTARSRYISTVITRITEVSSGKIAMRVDVNCSATVKKIEAVMTLQKSVNGSWTSVGAVSVSVSDAYKMSKTATATSVSSGTYRTKATVKVTDYNGYSETSTGYSGAISI